MYTVAALYKFVDLEDCSSLQETIKAQCTQLGIIGTILLAEEGINGTIAGKGTSIEQFLRFLRQDSRFADITAKISSALDKPFYRLKVKVKNEIVTMGVDKVSPSRIVGEYVDPEQWNQILEDPDVVIIDTRNDYETCVGSFEGAIHPNTRNFREFPEWLESHQEIKKDSKIAMFCTGGIRCEKATSYMKERGYNSVYHLKGGILQYLQDVSPEQSLWNGSCFVFDQRVGLEHSLKESALSLCFACGFPVTEEAKQDEKYEPGVSCPQCFGQYLPEQLARFRERQKQMNLAAERNEQHIGVARRHGDNV